MMKKKMIVVKGAVVAVGGQGGAEYISLTDIARYKNPDEPKDIIKNWMRTKSTIEFLGLWGKLHNPGFKGVEFDTFMYRLADE
ncbi:MAG TPA: KilA-N domain-containing protein [Bacteroidales bacterium]|nr:KilA-N domain-containing protein [Bacteroidales bacterium]